MCGELGGLLCHGGGVQISGKNRSSGVRGSGASSSEPTGSGGHPGHLPTPQLCPYLQEGPGVLGPGIGMAAQPRALGLWLQTLLREL